MHKPTRNESNLPHPGPQPDDLRDIRELNLLFLVLLQGRARRDVDCFGLAAPVKRRLRDASDAAVEGMSRFPRTVFRLNLDCVKSGPDIPAERDGQLRRARHALALTAALMAWNMARQRCFHARVFLGLSEDDTRNLQACPMMKLHEFAEHPAFIRCAFPNAVACGPGLCNMASAACQERSGCLACNRSFSATPGRYASHIPPASPDATTARPGRIPVRCSRGLSRIRP